MNDFELGRLPPIAIGGAGGGKSSVLSWAVTYVKCDALSGAQYSRGELKREPLCCVAPETRSEKPTNTTDAISAAVTPLHTRFSAVMLCSTFLTVEDTHPVLWAASSWRR